jgi:hypothetical protein
MAYTTFIAAADVPTDANIWLGLAGTETRGGGFLSVGLALPRMGVKRRRRTFG